jgi:integrase/recombinase XerD
MTPLRQRMIEDMRVRNLSANTQRLYVDRVAKFAQYFRKSPELLGPEDVRTYQVYLIHQKRASSSMLQQTVCALRFLYRNTLGKEWALPYIPAPRRERKLPVVLSQEEVSRFFDNLPNLKHRALIMTAYATEGPFDVWTLPWGAECGDHFGDFHTFWFAS